MGSTRVASYAARNLLAMWTDSYCDIASRGASKITNWTLALLRNINQLVVDCAVISSQEVVYRSNVRVCVGLDLYCSQPG